MLTFEPDPVVVRCRRRALIWSLVAALVTASLLRAFAVDADAASACGARAPNAVTAMATRSNEDGRMRSSLIWGFLAQRGFDRPIPLARHDPGAPEIVGAVRTSLPDSSAGKRAPDRAAPVLSTCPGRTSSCADLRQRAPPLPLPPF